MQGEHIRIYTDGSCYFKTKVGGWAFLVRHMMNEHIAGEWQRNGFAENTTISRMEMTAAAEGLMFSIEVNDKNLPIYVITDSQLVSNAFNEGWIRKWKEQRKLDYIKNHDLWKILIEIAEITDPIFVHTRGHGKGMDIHKEGNNIVDKLCSYKLYKR